MTSSQIHTPPHHSNSLLFSTQKKQMEWEIIRRDKHLALEENPCPYLFCWNCFQNMDLGFHSLNFYNMGTNSKDQKLQARCWIASMTVGRWETHNMNAMKSGRYCCVSWTCGCVLRELDQWDGWKCISCFTFNCKERKGDIKDDQKRNTIK